MSLSRQGEQQKGLLPPSDPNRRTSGEATINELAAHATNRETKKGILPGIPFVIAMPTVLVCALAAGIIPAIVIILNTAQSSVNDLTSQIIVVTALSGMTRWVQYMQAIMTATSVFADSPIISSFMTTKVRGFQNDPNVNLFGLEYYNNMGGNIRRQNITGELESLPADPTLRNSTQFSIYNSTTVCYIDYSASDNRVTISQQAVVSQFSSEFSRVAYGSPFKNPFINFGDPAYQPVSNQYRTLETCPPSGRWQAIQNKGVPRFTHGRCPTKDAGGRSAYVCMTGFFQDRSVLTSVSPVGISRIFLLANEFQLAAANVPVELRTSNPNSTALVNATASNDTVIAELSTNLVALYGGGVSKFIPISINSTNSFSILSSNIVPFKLQSDNNEEWATIALKVQLTFGEQFGLVVAMPKRALLGIALTIYAVQPLKRIIQDMGKATNFDFSMLSSGKFDESGVFSEVRQLQKTFNTMMKAFAGSIKQNREIRQPLKFKVDEIRPTSSFWMNCLLKRKSSISGKGRQLVCATNCLPDPPIIIALIFESAKSIWRTKYRPLLSQTFARLKALVRMSQTRSGQKGHRYIPDWRGDHHLARRPGNESGDQKEHFSRDSLYHRHCHLCSFVHLQLGDYTVQDCVNSKAWQKCCHGQVILEPVHTFLVMDRDGGNSNHCQYIQLIHARKLKWISTMVGITKRAPKDRGPEKVYVMAHDAFKIPGQTKRHGVSEISKMYNTSSAKVLNYSMGAHKFLFSRLCRRSSRIYRLIFRAHRLLQPHLESQRMEIIQKWYGLELYVDGDEGGGDDEDEVEEEDDDEEKSEEEDETEEVLKSDPRKPSTLLGCLSFWKC
ncbi:hypothetical protein BJ742DRAFT_734192 [Cladochytrium replicatum]|nr:hypothetical protein BJ742DRAFT_734192 [Cladochytrium replicatum]